MMEQLKISTPTRQLYSQIALGGDGEVILAAEGDDWYVERDWQGRNIDDFRSIAASKLGTLEGLAYIMPVFTPGCNEVTGEVKISLEASGQFPWRFDETAGDMTTISFREDRIPNTATFPKPGPLYLIWEGTSVKWVWSANAPPGNSTWMLLKNNTTEENVPSPTTDENKGQIKISALTRQRYNQIAHGTDGEVILAAEGDDWSVENVLHGGRLDDLRTIAAPKRGMIEALAYMTPVFTPGCNEVRGGVKMSTEAHEGFPWHFDETGGVTTINVAEDRIPVGVTFPKPGPLYLAWEGTSVKWVLSTGSPPSNSTWLLQKVKPIDSNTLEKVKIEFVPLAPRCTEGPRERSLAQDKKNVDAVVLTIEGGPWYLQPLSTTGADLNTKAIIALSLGGLQLMSQLEPVFTASTTQGGDTELNGEVRLTPKSRGGFPWHWVFEEIDGGYTITVPPGAIPPRAALPQGGKVYMVWQVGAKVKWQWSGGLIDQVPGNAIWTYDKFAPTPLVVGSTTN